MSAADKAMTELPLGDMQLVARQGFGWVMFMMAVGALVWLYKRSEADRKESDLHRREETKDTLKALAENTAAIRELTASLNRGRN